MKNAISKGMPSTLGHVFFEDYDSRFTEIARFPCPTGIPELDKRGILNGGLGRGELGVITAPTGVGKSHFLGTAGSRSTDSRKECNSLYVRALRESSWYSL